MNWSFIFFFNSVFLGVGLAMDAFSVSLANGLHEPNMKKGRMSGIAGVYAFFQFLMPMIGWICVHTIVKYLEAFEKFVPGIALALLLYIGFKMIWEAVADKGDSEETVALGIGTLIIQGIATSIDALSVGFTIADYNVYMAFICSLIVAVVTFVICIAGLEIGKRFGTFLSNKAGILGGVILIIIGIEIFIKGMFF